jgi:DNA-nicking Smr family endonuclease
MTRGRKPRADEIELWRAVAKTAEPMHRREASAQHPSKEPQPDAPLTQSEQEFLDALPNRLKGRADTSRTSLNLKPAITEQVAGASVQMDRKAFGRMVKGQLSPEARIDLHGMTLDRAHPALTRFILSQHAAGKRLVLVITGKGKVRDEAGPIPVRTGVLRHQVPEWLRLPPLRTAVLQVSPAHRKHGGAGAYYVYLRRLR